MLVPSSLGRCAVPFLIACFVAGCGGKTVGIQGNVTPDAGGEDTGTGLADSGSHSDAATQGGMDSGVCVDVDPSTLDQSCVTDSDCALVKTGQVCDGACSACEPNMAVSHAGLSVYQADVASIVQGQCAKCAVFASPSCIANRCTFCPEPGGCADSGTTQIEDAGPPPEDAGQCVQVSPSSFSRACATNSDCTLVTTGLLCSGGCACGDTPISSSSLAAYDAMTSSIVFEGCPCADPGQATCIQGTCTLCSFGPNQPPGCGDGG